MQNPLQRSFKSTKIIWKKKYFFSQNIISSLHFHLWISSQRLHFYSHFIIIVPILLYLLLQSPSEYRKTEIQTLNFLDTFLVLLQDLLDHKTDNFVRFSDRHSKTGPFPVFRWLLCLRMCWFRSLNIFCKKFFVQQHFMSYFIKTKATKVRIFIFFYLKLNINNKRVLWENLANKKNALMWWNIKSLNYFFEGAGFFFGGGTVEKIR